MPQSLKNFIQKLSLSTLSLTMLLFPQVTPAYAVAPVCTPTNFYRDGINMTAAKINPSGTVTGEVDATGCNIGIYYAPGTIGKVKNANIHGANYFGVLNQKGNVDIKNSSVHDIGESPLNGAQHGVAIYYASVDSPVSGTVCSAGTTKGTIDGNTITKYQKNGIVSSCTGSNPDITNNIVTGEGHIGYIAQNGIQVSYGAKAYISHNTVSGNSYTGTSTVSGGILIVGGPYYGNAFGSSFGAYVKDITIENNTLTNNDVGVYLNNLEVDGTSAPTGFKTNIDVKDNKISSDGLYNGYPYQAGISDTGRGDKLLKNTITGDGYSAAAHPGAAYGIDADPATYSPKVKIKKNDVVM